MEAVKAIIFLMDLNKILAKMWPYISIKKSSNQIPKRLTEKLQGCMPWKVRALTKCQISGFPLMARSGWYKFLTKGIKKHSYASYVTVKQRA